MIDLVVIQDKEWKLNNLNIFASIFTSFSIDLQSQNLALEQLGGCPRTQIFVKSRHKIVEKAQFTCVNEHFETFFNAELAER